MLLHEFNDERCGNKLLKDLFVQMKWEKLFFSSSSTNEMKYLNKNSVLSF